MHAVMEAPPTVAPRTSNTKGKELSAEFAKKKAAFDRIFKSYKERMNSVGENGLTASVRINFSPLNTLPTKPCFRATFLGFNFDGHCVVRLENKDFPFFQLELNEFYGSESMKAQNQIDPLELHEGWTVCSEGVNNFYRAEIKYIDPLLKFCSVKDIDGGEYHAVNFANLYHLEDRFFHTSAQVVECILEGLENMRESTCLLIASKLVLPDSRVKVTASGRKGPGGLPLVSITTSKGDSLVDLLDEFIDSEEDTEVEDIFENNSPTSEVVKKPSESTVKEEAHDSCRLAVPPWYKPAGDASALELEIAKEDVKKFMQSFCKPDGIPLLQLYGSICQYTGRPILWKKMGFPHWYIFLFHCEEHFYLKCNRADKRGNFLVYPTDHIDKPNNPPGYTRVEISILFKLLPSELRLAVKKFNGDKTPRRNLSISEADSVRDNIAVEARPVQKPMQSLVIPILDDSGTEADCSDYNSSPESKNKVFTLLGNGIIKAESSHRFIVSGKGERMEIVLKEEATEYLFYSNDSEGQVSGSVSPNPDLSSFTRPTRNGLQNRLRDAKAEVLTKAEPRSIKNPSDHSDKSGNLLAQARASFHSSDKDFTAKLLGVDMYGFFFIQKNDPCIKLKYDDHQRRLNKFFAQMDKNQYRLSPEEAMDEGKIVGFIHGNNFARARIFDSDPAECILVDLETHDFHYVNPNFLYRLDPQFLELPPQAMAVYLRGLECYLYTDAIPQAFQRTLLYPPNVSVHVTNDPDEVYLASCVQMKWGTKNEDVAGLLLKYGAHVLTSLDEDAWKAREQEMMAVREALMVKGYLGKLEQ